MCLFDLFQVHTPSVLMMASGENHFTLPLCEVELIFF
jgi:hypothetical protein